MSLDNEYKIYDCLYGPQEVSAEEYEKITFPEIQRLRYIRLSNIESITLTGGANISRYEHSLGTFFLAKKWINNNKTISLEEASRIKYAALFHDIYSAPFGHSFQYIFEDNETKQKFEHQNAKNVREANYYQRNQHTETFGGKHYKFGQEFSKNDCKEIEAYINGKGKYGKLISNEIDFDNIDNVIRLAFHIGILQNNEKEIPLKIINNMKLKNMQVVFTPEALPALEGWYNIRKRLYSLLLTEWSDFSQKAMLTYAVENLFLENQIENTQWNFTDQKLLSFLEDSVGKTQKTAFLIKKIKIGDLYHPFMLCKSSSINIYKEISKINVKRKIEKEIAKVTKINCIFHPILDVNKTNRVLNIFLETGFNYIIGKKNDCLLIGLFTQKKYGKKAKDDNREAIKRILVKYGIEKLEPMQDEFPSLEGNKGLFDEL